MKIKPAYIGSAFVITPFGIGLETNIQSILQGKIAYAPFVEKLYGKDFPLESAGLLKAEIFDSSSTDWTRSEVLLDLLLKEFFKNKKNKISLDACLLLYKNRNCYEPIQFPLTDQASVKKIFLHNGIVLSDKKIHIIDNTCTTGLTLLTHAAQGIHAQLWKNVFVCAIDLIDPFVTYLLHGLGALSRDSRPFDIDRKGFVKTESASCALVSETKAVHEGHDLMNLISFHQSNDAYRLTDGRDDCTFISLTMKEAIRRSGLGENDLAFIKAHGTGTQLNDLHESKAILETFARKDILVTSLKGHLGHTTDASGLIENLLAGYALKKNKILYTNGCTTTDCGLNIVRETCESNSPYFLSNSFGFGGNNASAIFKITPS